MVAMEKAAQILRDIRIAEVEELDMQIENGNVTIYSTRVKVSFRVRKTEELQDYKDSTLWLLRKNIRPSMVEKAAPSIRLILYRKRLTLDSVGRGNLV